MKVYTVLLFKLLQIFYGIALYILFFFALYFVLITLPRRRRRWTFTTMKASAETFADQIARRFTFLFQPQKLELKQELFTKAGFPDRSIVMYEFLRKLCFLLLIVLLILLEWLRGRIPASVTWFHPVWIASILLVLLLVVWFDRSVLTGLIKRRQALIMQEIYALSYQLLYYSSSRMNLHTKLTKCIPFTRTIRIDFERLLRQWHYDAGEALEAFKKNLGTEDGYSFVETLNALRLYEHQHYYDLLKQRIKDYKEKIELNRDSRKETASYLLFVLAGLPILYSFQVFIYPWVQQGLQLFRSLHG